MKKIIFTLLFASMGFIGMAQSTSTSTEKVEVTDAFKEVGVENVPKEVLFAVYKHFPTATLQKIYVNDKKQYKLEVALKSGTKGTFYADAKGNWLDI